MDCFRYIIDNGIDDLYLVGELDKTKMGLCLATSYYSLYIESNEKLIKISTNESTRINLDFTQKFEAWENPDDYEDFCYISIFKLVFKAETKAKIYNIDLVHNEIGDEMFITYQIYEEEKRILKLDPSTIFGFVLYNDGLI